MIEPITKEHQKFIDNMIPIKVREDKVIAKTRFGSVTIPSKMYPLSKKRTIKFFSNFNTEMIDESLEDYEKLKRGYDNVDIQVGFCYRNTENVYESLIKEGIKPEDLKTYVGWLIHRERPIHHCWLMYKDKYMIDGSTSIADFIARNRYIAENVTDLKKQRDILVEESLKCEKLHNSEHRGFGKATYLFHYIGTECVPNDGRVIWNKMMEQFPNHPSYPDGGGITPTQQMLYEKKK